VGGRPACALEAADKRRGEMKESSRPNELRGVDEGDELEVIFPRSFEEPCLGPRRTKEDMEGAAAGMS